MPKRPKGAPRGDQHWLTFVRNHAQVIVACDFCVAVTATFQALYVSVVMEYGSRRALHANVTRHPTAHWTLQQLREAMKIRASDSAIYEATTRAERSRKCWRKRPTVRQRVTPLEC